MLVLVILVPASVGWIRTRLMAALAEAEQMSYRATAEEPMFVYLYRFTTGTDVSTSWTLAVSNKDLRHVH